MSVSLLRQAIRGLGALFRPARADGDVADEVADYLERATAVHLARGLSQDEARRAAQLEMGGALGTREAVRGSGWEHLLLTVLQDIRYAFRGLRRRPVFAATAVALLALGIGAATAVYSAVRPILIEPLPFPEAERLVTIDDLSDQGIPMPATLGTYAEVRARSHGLQAIAAADQWRPSLTGTGEPERLEGQRVTLDYFGVFGASPLRGRGFSADEDQPGGPSVVVVGAGLAERRFGGVSQAVGRTIELDGDSYEVIGVMPPAFQNVLAPAAQVWAPIRERTSGDFGASGWGHHYRLVARLAPALTIEDATREMLSIGSTPIDPFPRPTWARLSRGLAVRPLRDAVVGTSGPALRAIIWAVLVLLVMASVNVANLLLARGAERRPELTLRMTLGAGRPRLVRQLLTESVALALLGGIAGWFVAEALILGLVAASPPGLPRVGEIRLDAPVFAFALLLTTVIGVLVGLWPAAALFRDEGGGRLGQDSRRTTPGRDRVRSALVVAEVALALVLLVSAGLLLRSVERLLAVAPGFEPAGVVTLKVVEAGHGFDSDPAKLGFYQDALEAVSRVPGVQTAAFTSQVPLSGEVDGYGLEAESRAATNSAENGSALRYAVTPGYFRAMRIPLLRGRVIEATDRPGGPPVVVINAALAHRLFGDQDPIGQRMRFGPEMGSNLPWREVVGVVGDVRHYSLAVGAPDAFYIPSGQWPWVDNDASLVVRTTGDAARLVASLRQALWSVNATVPVPRAATMAEFIRASAGSRQLARLAIETFALAALLLAAVGLHGVVATRVNERIREIGIRTALGATRGAVVGHVVRGAFRLSLAGTIIGLAGALAATRFVAAMLFGVSALDPITYLTVVVLLGVVALLAAWAPAMRAAGVDPVIALRAE